jgi:hypothetical protein
VKFLPWPVLLAAVRLQNNIILKRTSQHHLALAGLLYRIKSYKASTTIAIPCPPPKQREATPYFPFRLLNSLMSVYSILAPLAPTGCPSARAPPLTFVLLRSNCNSFSTAKYWTAKASFTSTSFKIPLYFACAALC